MERRWPWKRNLSYHESEGKIFLPQLAREITDVPSRAWVVRWPGLEASGLRLTIFMLRL